MWLLNEALASPGGLVRAPGEDRLGCDGGADRAQARPGCGRDRPHRLRSRRRGLGAAAARRAGTSARGPAGAGTGPGHRAGARLVGARPVVEATGSLILWDALSSVYDA